VTIDRFSGRYNYLSNFSPHPVTMPDGREHRTAEHAFQSAKAVTLSDYDFVTGQPTPGRAKQAGRRIARRQDWDEVRDAVMLAVIRAKFTRGTMLANLLDLTGDEELVEGNTWGDRYWGVCGGSGENRLGKILMQVRSENRACRADASALDGSNQQPLLRR
jgi:ribA/ribD-fused uncharacterized protein